MGLLLYVLAIIGYFGITYCIIVSAVKQGIKEVIYEYKESINDTLDSRDDTKKSENEN